MNKYEERLQAVAIEFVQALPSGHDLSKIRWEHALTLARLCVQREAEAYRISAKDWLTIYEEKHITAQLIERGLIPPQTQTTI